MWNIVEGIKYLHQNGIVHRDLKPENILISSSININDIKIADFGISCIIGEKRFLMGISGTTPYMAPELFTMKDNSPKLCMPSRDIWSLGVILYILLSGSPPFYKKTGRPVIYQIISGYYNFPKPLFSNVSKSAIDLIKKMMEPNPTLRITLDGILNHPWMKQTPTIQTPLFIPPLIVKSPLFTPPIPLIAKPPPVTPLVAYSPIPTVFSPIPTVFSPIPTVFSPVPIFSPIKPPPINPLVAYSPVPIFSPIPLVFSPVPIITKSPVPTIFSPVPKSIFPIKYVFILDVRGRKRYYVEKMGKRLRIAFKKIPIGVVPVEVSKR